MTRKHASDSSTSHSNVSNLQSNSTKADSFRKAILDRDIDSVSYFISLGVDVNTEDDEGNTLLHLVAQQAIHHRRSAGSFDDRFTARKLCRKRSIEIVKIAESLLQSNANVNARNKNGWTPLHLASSKANDSLVELLLKHNADICIKNNNGDLPLNVANFEFDMDTVMLLVDHGSDVNCASISSGSTILHRVCGGYSNNVFGSVKFLYKNGADINAVNNKDWTPLMCVLKAVSNRPRVNQLRYQRKIDTVEFLLKKGCDVNLISSDGECILNLVEFDSYISLDEKLHNIIFQHVAKMESLGLLVHPSLINTISEKKEFSGYFIKCKEELMVTKVTKIHPNYSVTYFQLLVADNTMTLVTYARNKHLVELFESCDICKIFPIYANLMKKKMNKGVKMRRLLDDAEKSLKICFPPDSNPSHLVLRKILCYLQEKDLRSLCECSSRIGRKEHC